MTEFKICGLTRPQDAAAAVEAGAAYCGVILADGPRLLAPARAAEVLNGAREAGGGAGGGARAVGVFAYQSVDEIARIAEVLRLDVLQLHGSPTAERVEEARRLSGREVWAVLRIRTASDLEHGLRELGDTPDAIVLDAWVPDRLGGTGRTLDWPGVSAHLTEQRRGGRLVLAGGLNPQNVAHAIAVMLPDVADVSSGVERSIGVKDPELIRAFARAVETAY